jgi:signal peptidase I
MIQPGTAHAAGPVCWPLGWMVMMNDEQRANDVLAAGDGSAADSAAKNPAMAATEADPRLPERAATESESDEQDADEAQEPKSRWSFLTEMVVLFAVALTIALLIKTFVVQPFYIPSASMENTLLIGDKVLVNKIVYRIRPISRGDIVVFNGAGSWQPPEKAAPPNHNPLARFYDATLGKLFTAIRGLFGTAPGQTDYIKRVIGVPGDHIFCCNAKGEITVNGVPLRESSYLIPGAKPSEGPFNIAVPPGRLWVMGDNRPQSADSRLHYCSYTYTPPQCVSYDRSGTVPEGKVIGRAFMIIWPPSRIRILPIPSTFSQRGLNHASALRSAGGQAAAAAAIPVRPSAPYLPLAGGLAAAVPLTALERRLRLRTVRRRRRGSGGLVRRRGAARDRRRPRAAGRGPRRA